jgi:hypothetical protein
VPLADGPRGGFQPAVRRVLRVFLCALSLIHFAGGFLLHGVRGRSVLECWTVHDKVDDPRAHRGRSVTEGAVLEVRGLFSDGPAATQTVRLGLADGLPGVRGQSAQASRTVRPVLADSPLGPVLSCSVLCSLSFASLWDRLGFSPRVGRSALTTLPWQTCVGIRGCEFGA